MLIVLLSLLIAGGASAQQNCRDCGVAILMDRIYDLKLNTYVVPSIYEADVRFLFYDSMMIVERYGITSHTDVKGIETAKRFVIGYKFIDFRTQSYYRYVHFSDTARIMKKMREIPGAKAEDGENYLSFTRNQPNAIFLPDTVLDGTKCHRIRGFWTRNNDTLFIETMYYVDEKERPVAYYGKTEVNDKLYSYFRLDYFNVARKIHRYSSMDITSRNLTKKELKVFEAWRKNAKKYPVKK
jgi:hypothetical protein